MILRMMLWINKQDGASPGPLSGVNSHHSINCNVYNFNQLNSDDMTELFLDAPRRGCRPVRSARRTGLFKQLRIKLLEFDSLPPLSLDTPNSLAERTLGILFRNIIQKFIHLCIINYYFKRKE